MSIFWESCKYKMQKTYIRICWLDDRHHFLYIYASNTAGRSANTKESAKAARVSGPDLSDFRKGDWGQDSRQDLPLRLLFARLAQITLLSPVVENSSISELIQDHNPTTTWPHYEGQNIKSSTSENHQWLCFDKICLSHECGTLACELKQDTLF